ncbi:hypothetical protein K469DRAFT_593230, partial [Zopfia rhizophila CBS 207.26]
SSRRLGNGLNIFEVIRRNTFFIRIDLIMMGAQVLIIFIGGRAFNVTRLNGPQLGISIVLGTLSLPMGILIQLIPGLYTAKVIPFTLWKQ